MEPITVLLAARRRATRAACLAALAGASGLRVVAQPRSAAETLAAAHRFAPDVAVVAAPVASPRLLTLLDALGAARRPRVLLVAVAPHTAVVAALARGARGHLTPARVPRWLARAVDAVARGGTWYARALETEIVAAIEHRNECEPER